MPPRSPRSRRSNAAAFPSSPPILNLSHDTLALICDLLFPVDVLNLSRSCKSIHDFLHQDSSKFVWKTARANVQGLPDCPKWLTEPQFASLCFEDFCFRCLATDSYSRSPVWPFGVRYCLPCRAEAFTARPLKDFPAGVGLGRFKSRPADLFCGILTIPKGGGALSRKVLSFYVRDVQEFRGRTAALVAKGGADSPATAASVLALLEEKASDTKERVEFARQCKSWHVQWKAQLAEAARAIKVQRQQDILRKLEDAGYANEVRELGPRYEGLSDEVRAITNQARPLTEREWNLIRPALTTFMDGRRELGARVAFVRQVRSRLRVLNFSLFAYLHQGDRRDKRIDGARAFPSLLDLLDVREVAYLITLPDGAIVMPKLWATRLPLLVEAWERGREETLISLLHETPASSTCADVIPPSLCQGTAASSRSIDIVSLTPSGDASITTRSAAPCSSPLLHPSALFWCGGCTSLVAGVLALSHACCYGRAHPPDVGILNFLNPALDGRFSQALITSDSEDCLFRRTLIAFSEGILPWSHQHLQGCGPIARSVLKTCGAEVHDLPRDLQRVNSARIACLTCCQDGKCVLAMSWVRAISHAFEVHGGQEGSWVRLPPKLEDKVRRVEYSSAKLFSGELEASGRWECICCTWDKPEAGLAYTWPQLVNHLAVYHPMADLSPTWYRRSEDSPPFMYPAVLCVERGAEGVFDENAGELFPQRHLVTSMKLSEFWGQLKG